MARNAPTFICQNCGARFRALAGQMRILRRMEHHRPGRRRSDGAGPGRPARKGRPFELEPLAGETQKRRALPSGIAELDRVTGGGFVRGSVLLVGGDPGIGKSTLLIQAAAALANAGQRVVYISGEEAVAQVRLRAERLGLSQANVELAAETSVEDIIATLSQGKTPRLVVIDSIQTMWTDTVESAPGTVTQVRSSAQALIRFAKRSGADDHARRPRHQGRPDRRPARRRAHGRCRALFRGRRRAPFPHPARRQEPLRPDRRDRRVRNDRRRVARSRQSVRAVPVGARRGTPGTAVFAGIEGTRPLLVEIQALVAPSALGTPRRAVVGWDPAGCRWCSRCSRRIAACGLSSHDVYLNVAGGLRIVEPAADLAAAAALVSSLTNAPLPADAVYFGEVSLSGVVRPVAQAAARLKEAQKLGFGRAVDPGGARGEAADTGLAITQLAHCTTLVADIAAAARRRRRTRTRPVCVDKKGDGPRRPGYTGPRGAAQRVPKKMFWTVAPDTLAGNGTVGSGWVAKLSIRLGRSANVIIVELAGGFRCQSRCSTCFCSPSC